MENTLIDNSDNFLMAKVLKDSIADTRCDHICIATGYWDMPGTKLVYDELKAFFERGGKMQLLLGQEPQLRDYQQKKDDDSENDICYPDFYLQRDFNQLTDEFIDVAKLLIEYCHFDEEQENSPLQIRVYGQNQEKKQFLHAKCYIFLGAKAHHADGIIGSSNFTFRGLKDNAELNFFESSNSVVAGSYDEYSNTKSHRVWFDEKWENSVPWNGKFIEIIGKSPIGSKVLPSKEPAPAPQPESLTPYETYIKLLQDKFGNLLDANATSLLESYLPKNYQILDYQIEASKQCIDIMHTHGGFLLGDVVGLGKTIVGVLAIKYFLESEENDGREKNVLIIAPPAIKSSWERTIEDFDKDRADKIMPSVDFITTGSLAEADEESDAIDFNEDLKDKNYGFILIDESHNFRSNGTQMYIALDGLISKIAIETGYCPYIGLLSATPQNNHPYDIRNQIFLFQRTPESTTLEKVPGRKLDTYFTDLGKKFKEAVAISKYNNKLLNTNGITEEDKKVAKEKLEEAHETLKDISSQLRENVLNDIMVRRTRSDIKNPDNHYKAKIDFPDVVGPIKLEYKLDKELAQLFSDTSKIIGDDSVVLSDVDEDGQTVIPWVAEQQSDSNDGQARIHYYRYRATIFLADKYKKRYEGKNMSVNRSSHQLARIMQMLLVKRLESSLDAFKESLRNLQRYTNNMIQMWNDDTIFICPNIDVNAELDLETKREKYGNQYTIEKCYDDIIKRIGKLPKKRNAKGQNALYHQADFSADYITMLKNDKKIIDNLVQRWDKNTHDPKLNCFNRKIDSLFDSEKNHPQKLVIFSEAISTTEAIGKAVEDAGYRPLIITAKNRDFMEQTIRENFDANYDKSKQKNDYNVIITTEVLAEGINLHRANTILNYDTPWNATRLIQRIGRVNRIGSTEKNVYVYNFYPSAEGDQTINLVQTAYSKLQSFHTMFGEDSKVFSDEEELSHNDLNKLIDGEESPYQSFVNELKEYQQQNPERFSFIASKSDNLQTSFNSDNDKGSYCLVKIEGVDYGGVYVYVDADGKAETHSCIEVLKQCKCTPDTVAVDSIQDFSKIEESAIYAYNVLTSKQHKPTGKAKIFDEAKAIIRRLINDTPDVDAESKKLLNFASKLVNKCNNSIAKKIIAIDKELNSPQLELMPLNVNDIIKNELNNIGTQVAQKHGEPYVFISVNKQ